MDLATVDRLLGQGLKWGEQLASLGEYLILGECVVGGTTTALAVLTGLGFAAAGKVNSSHPTCNHAQKWELVTRGLQRAGFGPEKSERFAPGIGRCRGRSDASGGGGNGDRR